jgi:hypothetical protein
MLGTQATISITANDAETGVKQIMYSINGQGFNIYSSPITLNTLASTTVIAVADNNVGIRSGVYTKKHFDSNGSKFFNQRKSGKIKRFCPHSNHAHTSKYGRISFRQTKSNWLLQI